MTKAEAEVERVEVRVGREGGPPAGSGRGMPLTRHARRASALQDVEDDIDDEDVSSDDDADETGARLGPQALT